MEPAKISYTDDELVKLLDVIYWGVVAYQKTLDYVEWDIKNH